MTYKKIGIVVADVDEYVPFEDAINKKTEFKSPFRKSVMFEMVHSQVLAVCSGIGKVNAATAAMFLIDNGCEVILNFGFSGGLDGVSRGRFILPDGFLEYDFDLTPLGYKPCEKPGQEYFYKADENLIKQLEGVNGVSRATTAACGDRFVNNSADREFLINTFSASSCDMETAAIASVCHLTNTPFAALRRISDDADDDAAESYGEMNRTGGETLTEVFMHCLELICREE